MFRSFVFLCFFLCSRVLCWSPDEQYSLSEAQRAWKYSIMAYDVNQNADLVEKAICTKCLLSDIWGTKTYNKHQSEGFTTLEFSTKTFIFSFAGSWSIGDWTDNVQWHLSKTICGNVHNGFVDHANRIKDDMISHYQRVASKFKINKIILTGHSLGGAIAQYFACYLKQSKSVIGNPKIIVHSFGAPRVGTSDWVIKLMESVTMHWRHVNYNDQVPYLPPGQHFYNAPQTVLMESPQSSNGKFCSKFNAEDRIFENCHYQTLLTDNFTNMISSLFGVVTNIPVHLQYFGIQNIFAKIVDGPTKTMSGCNYFDDSLPTCEFDAVSSQSHECGLLNMNRKVECVYDFKGESGQWSQWSQCDIFTCLKDNDKSSNVMQNVMQNGQQRRTRFYTQAASIRVQHETRNCQDTCLPSNSVPSNTNQTQDCNENNFDENHSII